MIPVLLMLAKYSYIGIPNTTSNVDLLLAIARSSEPMGANGQAHP
jgi:hypothetical protein